MRFEDLSANTLARNCSTSFSSLSSIGSIKPAYSALKELHSSSSTQRPFVISNIKDRITMDGAPEPVRVGGVNPMENLETEHHDFIKAALEQSKTHAGRKYKIVRATQQVVAGSLHTFYIVFEDDETQQEYKITAWSRPWLQDKGEGLKLTFDKHEKK